MILIMTRDDPRQSFSYTRDIIQHGSMVMGGFESSKRVSGGHTSCTDGDDTIPTIEFTRHQEPDTGVGKEDGVDG